jgi:GMP synthase-like glutamine amidotransferase
MKLGILKTGAPPADVGEGFGSYPQMFERLLGEGAYDYAVYDVEAGALPRRPQDHAAYIITGSPAGVYDPLPWIPKLQQFLVDAKGKAALVGICFGHQIMAEAFGGKAAKSDKGWGIGLHDYRVESAEPWMDGAKDFRVAASHQDQVLSLPPGARVIAGSAFTPYGMLAYDDQPAISLQLHPEFAPDYAKALIEVRRGTRFPEHEADKALASFEAGDDRSRVGGWIKSFLAKAK